MDDVQRQLAALGKGMVQVNLRLSRLVELAESGGAARAEGPPALDLLFDLLQALDQTLATADSTATSAAVRPRPWWAALFPTPPPLPHPPAVDLQGLRIARADVGSRLEQAGVRAIATQGPVDARVHQVIEVRATQDPHLDGTICCTHRTGWLRAGDPPHVLRLAQVTAWRHPEG